MGLLRRAALESQNHIVVRRLVEQVCSQLDSKDYISEYQALYRFMLQRCRYMRDPRTVELVRAPYVVAQEIMNGGTPQLDCDDMTASLGAWFLAVGGQTRFATLAFRDAFYNGRRQYSHVLAEAFEPKTSTWVVFD